MTDKELKELSKSLHELLANKTINAQELAIVVSFFLYLIFLNIKRATGVGFALNWIHKLPSVIDELIRE